MLNIKVVTWSLAIWSAFTFVFCVVFALLTPSSLYMHSLLLQLLPGFEWFSWRGFIVGLIESFLYGAYAGLVPRRSQSGERDTRGRISKAGDPMLRRALYEAANSLLARVKRDCALRRWGLELAATKGAKRARVAVARKLAALLHTLWRTNTSFRWA